MKSRLRASHVLLGTPRSPREGWSLIEIAIVVIAILILGTVVVLYTLNRREELRRVHCAQRLNRLHTHLARSRSAPLLVADGKNWLESSLDDLPADSARTVPELLCPADLRTTAGGLSYVINGGFGVFDVRDGRVSEPRPHACSIDLDGDGTVSGRERQITRATGVCWRKAGPGEPAVKPWRWDEIQQADGLDATLLLSENLNARQWSSEETFDLAFVLGRGQLAVPEPAGDRALDLRPFDPGPFRINANPGTLPGASPAPGAHHLGIVNVIFASGRGQALSQSIDPLVYARLMTPGGTRFGEPAP